MDREDTAHGQAIKDIYVYPLVHNAQQTAVRGLTSRRDLYADEKVVRTGILGVKA
jgi:hypothetical protein